MAIFLLGGLFSPCAGQKADPTKFFGVWEGRVFAKAKPPGESSVHDYTYFMRVVIVADTVSPKENFLQVTLIETNAPADTGDTDEFEFKTHLRARVEGQRWAEMPDSVEMLRHPLEALVLVNPPEKRAEALMGMMFGVALMAIEELTKDSA